MMIDSALTNSLTPLFCKCGFGFTVQNNDSISNAITALNTS